MERRLFALSFHRGVIGLARQPEETGDVISLVAELTDDAVVGLCPALVDAADAGAILRNAAALGAAAVFSGREGVSPFERKAVRASGGALFRVPVRVADGLRNGFAECRRGQCGAAVANPVPASRRSGRSVRYIFVGMPPLRNPWRRVWWRGVKQGFEGIEVTPLEPDVVAHDIRLPDPASSLQAVYLIHPQIPQAPQIMGKMGKIPLMKSRSHGVLFAQAP